jgi:TP901 family phage tail tape measure protein
MAGHTLSYIATLNATGFMTGMRSMMTSLTSVGSGVTSLTGKITSLVTTLAKIGAVIGIAAIGGAAIAMGKATQAAIAWEASMANVAKTTGLQGQELESLGNEFLDLSTKISTSKEQLADIAAVGGTLGIKGDQLSAFTETVAQMTVAFEMSGEEAATFTAQTLNAFGAPISEAQNMGNAVNALGNNFATNERNVMNALQGMAGTAKQYNESVADSAAYATVLLAQGVEASEVGTGLQSALKVAASDADKMQSWAKLMGTDVKTLNQMLSDDLYGTLQKSGDALSSIGNEVERNTTAMDIWGAYGGKQIGKLIGQEENLTRARKMANEQYAGGTALADEFNAKEATTAAQIQRIKNTWAALLVDIGKNVNKSETFQGILQRIHEILLRAREVVQNFSIDNLKEKFSGISEKIHEIGNSAIQNKDKILTLVTAFVLLKTGALQQIAIVVAQTLAGFARVAVSGAASLAGMVSSVIAKYAMMASGAIANLTKMAVATTAQFARMAIDAARECSVMAIRVIASFTMMSSRVIATVIKMSSVVVAQFAKMAAMAMRALLGPLVALIGPIGIVIGAITALGASLLIDWNSVKSGLTSIKDALLDVWESVKEGNFSEAFEKIKDYASEAFDTIKDKLSNYDWSELPKKLVEDFKKGLDTIKDVGSDIVEKLKSGALSAISKFSELLDNLKEQIIGYDWENVGQQTARLLKDAMYYAWLGLLALWDIGGQIWNWIKESLGKSEDTSWFNVISDAFWKFWDGFKTELIADQTWGEALKSAITNVLPKIENTFRGFASTLLITLATWEPEWTNIFINAFNNVSDSVTTFINDVIAKFGALYDTLAWIAGEISGVISRIFSDSESGVTSAMNPGYFEGKRKFKKDNGDIENYTYEQAQSAKRVGYILTPLSLNNSLGLTSKSIEDTIAQSKTLGTVHISQLDWESQMEDFQQSDMYDTVVERETTPEERKTIAGEGTTSEWAGVTPGTYTPGILENIGTKYSEFYNARLAEQSFTPYQIPLLPTDTTKHEQWADSITGYNRDMVDNTNTTKNLIETSNKIEEEGTTQVTNSIDDMRNALIANNIDVASTLDKIKDATKSTSDNIVEVAEAVTKEPVTGYFDPSNMGPDDFRNKVESMGNMFAESIIAPSDVYVDRIIEKLQNAEYVHPAQLNMAAKLSDSSVEDLVAQIEAEKPTMTAEIESSTAIDQATTLDTDISTMVPEMEVSLLTTNALLDAQSLFASIERMNPHMQVSVDISANAGQIADIARAAVRDAINEAYS